VVVEDGSGIGKILKPGIKDPKAADKKRLEGVLEVIGAQLSIEQQKSFLGEHYAGFVTARDVLDSGFVDTVKSMKLYLDGVARTHTVKLDELTGAIDQIGEIPDEVVLGESVESLALKVSELTMETRDATRARDAADNALKVLSEAKGLKPVAEVEVSIEDTRKFIAVNEQKLKDLQESLAEAKLILTRNEAIVEAERVAEKNRETLRKAIDTAPTLEAIEAKRLELAALTEQHKAAVLCSGDNERVAKQRKQLVDLKSKREFSEATRDSIKELAHRLPELLHSALKEVPGWTVDEELRLCVEHRRGQIPFSELSPGEGTSRVCLLACQFAKYGEDEIPVVGLPQECFEGLDGGNRKLLLEKAQEHGLCILTAEASDEHVDGIQVVVLS
jgi:hypothetical protein